MEYYRYQGHVIVGQECHSTDSKIKSRKTNLQKANVVRDFASPC